MELTINKTKTNYTVSARNGFKTLSLIFSFYYLDEGEAKQKATEFHEHIKRIIIFGWDEIVKCFEEERIKRDMCYMEKGKGIIESSGKKCYSVYFRYINGRSPNFRIQFSKMQFGVERAYNLAKRFYKDFFLLENDVKSTDKDVDKLVHKYEKIKIQQELINLAFERRKRLQEYREKKYDCKLV